MKANCGATLTAFPDLHAEVVRATQDGRTAWSEWHWWGRLESGEPFELRGVAVFDVVDGLITAGRLLAELVERGGAGIAESVEASSDRSRSATTSDWPPLPLTSQVPSRPGSCA
jgi:crotonobetainyl-CoA:carnitine CoA-transferase CaiB-like acyl-CoA transferase